MARRALRPVGQSLWAACRSFSEGGLRAKESSAFLLEMPRAGARGASHKRQYLSVLGSFD